MANNDSDHLFVQIGLQQRLFQRHELEEAREAERASGTPVGQVLVQRGVISADQLQGLERAVTYRLGRDEDKRIARIMIDSGYCEEAGVERALRQQKDLYAKSGDLIRLGTLLQDLGSITDSQHLAAKKIFTIEQLGDGPPK